MDKNTAPDSGLEDLENERPGFTPAGNIKDDKPAEDVPSTLDRHQPSALGGEVATTSKVPQDD
jgi:hypothetical protein